MHTLLIALAMITFTQSAIADFSGNWTGKGTLQISGKSYAADPVSIKVTQLPTSIESEDCWTIKEDGSDMQLCSDRTLQISGSTLYYQGQAVGSISADQISVDFTSANITVRASAKLQPDGSVDFKSTTVDHLGGSVNAHATGLTRQP